MNMRTGIAILLVIVLVALSTISVAGRMDFDGMGGFPKVRKFQ